MQSMLMIKRHIKIFCLLFLVLLGTVFFLNILIDPYDIYGNILHIKKRPSEFKNKSHLIKAVQVIHAKPDILILGSSTVDCGYALQGSTSHFDNPEFKTYRRQLDDKLKGVKVFNAGINGATLHDIYTMLQHAYKNNEQLKHVYIGLEWHLFTEEMPPTNAGPEVPAFNKTYLPLPTLLKTTLTLQALKDSARTMPPNFKVLRNLGRIYDKVLARLPAMPTAFITENSHTHDVLMEEPLPVYFKPRDEQLIIGQKGPETTALLLSLYYLSTLYGYYEKHGQDAVLNPEAFHYLKKIVTFAKQKNIPLDIYLTPQHGTHWATAQRFGLGIFVEEWLRQLAKITPFWDFSGRIDFHDNVSDYFGGDDRHFNYTVGTILLPTLLAGKADPQSGIFYAHEKNVEALIKKRRALQARWLRHNPYLAQIFNHQKFPQLRHQKADMQKLLVQMKPLYHNYYVFRFIGEMIALPKRDAPYDLGQILRQDYPQMIQARTREEMLNKIKSQVAAKKLS